MKYFSSTATLHRMSSCDIVATHSIFILRTEKCRSMVERKHITEFPWLNNSTKNSVLLVTLIGVKLC
jgi:hypothetical protein